MPLAGPIATWKWGARCTTGSPGGPVGCCPRSRGVSRGAGGRDRGGRRPSSRPEVLTAPRGARECPYKAHVRIVSGSGVPDGLSGGQPVRGACCRSGSPLVAVPAHGPDRVPGPRGMAVWKRANHNRSSGLDRDARGTLSQKPFRDTCLAPTAVAFRGERVAP